MSAELISRFEQYRVSVSIERVRMSAVPADLKPLVSAYRDALSNQLADPENESWDQLGPNEHHNALKSVRMAFTPYKALPRGNCPRCDGRGHILAFSHVHGGKCLKCGGTGNIKS